MHILFASGGAQGCNGEQITSKSNIKINIIHILDLLKIINLKRKEFEVEICVCLLSLSSRFIPCLSSA